MKVDRPLKNRDRNQGTIVPPAIPGPAFLRWPIVQTIRLQLRFLLPLIAVVIATAYLVLPLVDGVTLRWFSRDLDSRGAVVANALSDSVVEALRANKLRQLEKLFDRAVQDERLFAIGLCGTDGRMLVRTPAFPPDLNCFDALQITAKRDPRLLLNGGPVHLAMHDVIDQPHPTPAAEAASEAAAAAAASAVPGASAAEEGAAVAAAVAASEATAQTPPVTVGRLVLLHDLSFIEKRSQDTRRYLVGLIAVLGFVMALITMVVAQLSWRGWVSGVRALLRGEGIISPLSGGSTATSVELEPFAADLRERLRDLEDEYRRMQGPETDWSAERLQALLMTQLRGDQVIVVSNREPYIHERLKDGSVVVKRPASGLVTAVEPVMRACSGTWIAHRSRSADRH